MAYALLLNDMRAPNIENIQVVRTAATPSELADWYTAQIVDPWKDGQWNKVFAQGSELEWYNPVIDIGRLGDYFGGVWEVPEGTPVGVALTKGRW